MNNIKRRGTEYLLSVSSPLLRPGLSLQTGPVSERYVVETAKKLLSFVREINSAGQDSGGDGEK